MRLLATRQLRFRNAYVIVNPDRFGWILEKEIKVFLKTASVFLGMVAIQSIFYGIIFFTVARMQTKVIFGIQFSSIWSFWIGIVAITLPLILVANYLILIFYCSGYQWITQSTKVWPIQIVVWASGPFAFLLLAYFVRHELPSTGSLIGFLLCVAGAIIAILWK